MGKNKATDKEKQDYWKEKMSKKLEQGFQAALPYLQEVAKMAEFQGIEKKDLEAGIMEIGEGFNTLRDLIEKKKTFAIKIRKPKNKN